MWAPVADSLVAFACAHGSKWVDVCELVWCAPLSEASPVGASRSSINRWRFTGRGSVGIHYPDALLSEKRQVSRSVGVPLAVVRVARTAHSRTRSPSVLRSSPRSVSTLWCFRWFLSGCALRPLDLVVCVGGGSLFSPFDVPTITSRCTA